MRTPARGSRTASLLAASALALLLGGCGSTGDAHHEATPKGMHRMSDGTLMKDSEMKSGPDSSSDEQLSHVGVGGKPSQTASMVCGKEIQAAVVRTFSLRATPAHSSTWSNQLFRCTYQLPSGASLRLSVKDLNSEPAGRTYFDHLRSSLPAPRQIKGIAAFGFPAFETRRGDVAFIKDQKTLWVDASQVRASDLPPGFTRTGVAYGVASAVIACWTE